MLQEHITKQLPVKVELIGTDRVVILWLIMVHPISVSLLIRTQTQPVSQDLKAVAQMIHKQVINTLKNLLMEQDNHA